MNILSQDDSYPFHALLLLPENITKTAVCFPTVRPNLEVVYLPCSLLFYNAGGPILKTCCEH